MGQVWLAASYSGCREFFFFSLSPQKPATSQSFELFTSKLRYTSLLAMSLENPSRSARKLDCQKPQCREGPSGVNPNVPSSRIQLEVHPVPRALVAMAMLG